MHFDGSNNIFAVFPKKTTNRGMQNLQNIHHDTRHSHHHAGGRNPHLQITENIFICTGSKKKDLQGFLEKTVPYFQKLLFT